MLMLMLVFMPCSCACVSVCACACARTRACMCVCACVCVCVREQELEIKTRVNKKSNSDSAVSMRAQLKVLTERRQELRAMLQDVLSKPLVAVAETGEGGRADAGSGRGSQRQPSLIARIAKSTFVQVCACACTAYTRPTQSLSIQLLSGSWVACAARWSDASCTTRRLRLVHGATLACLWPCPCQ